MLEKLVSMLESANESPDAFGCGMLFLFMFFIFWSLIDSVSVLYMKVMHTYKFRHLKNKLRQYIDAYNSNDDVSVRFVSQDIIDDLLRENGYVFDIEFGYIRKPYLIDRIVSWFKHVLKSIR